MSDVYGNTPQAPVMGEPLHPTQVYPAAWEIFKPIVGVSIGVTVVYMVIEAVGGMIPFVSVLFSLLVAPALAAGLAAFALTAARGARPDFELLFSGFRRWGASVGVMLLMWLAMLGMMLPMIIAIVALGVATSFSRVNTPSAFALAVIIPLGVVTFCAVMWWATRMQFAFFAVMDTDALGATGALRRSWELTRGSVWRLIGLSALSALVMLVGLLALCVGIFVAAPVVYFALALAYDHLRARAGLDKPTLPPPPPVWEQQPPTPEPPPTPPIV
jgi:uncharacterized membrane protein